MQTTSDWPVPIRGQCGCGHVRYQLNRKPLFIHCCSCHQCQLETGSAFALNGMIEAEEAVLLPSRSGETPELRQIVMPSDSGKGQVIARCPRCFVALWGYYCGNGPHIRFIRMGTLDKQSVDGRDIEKLMKPDVWVYAPFKQPWVPFPEYAHTENRIFEEEYGIDKTWPAESLQRLQAVRVRGREWRANGEKWSDLGEVDDIRISDIHVPPVGPLTTRKSIDASNS